MQSIRDRVPDGLGSLLLGAIASGFVGAIIAQYTLVGFSATGQLAAAWTALVGLTLAGLAWLRRGLRGLWSASVSWLG